MILQFKKSNYTIFICYISLLIIIKLILMGSCSSDYEELMFYPFISKFLEGIGTNNWNPYNYYYKNNLLSSFPYPPGMLIIQAFGGLLSHLFPSSIDFIRHITFKLPLLFFDCLAMYYLMKMFPWYKRYIGILYFSSPILIYAIYMHAQLDIIPTSLLLGSLYYLTKKKNRNVLSAVFLAFALLTKLHILAVLPILFFYLYYKEGLKGTFLYFIITFALLCIGIFPFYGEGLLHTVLLNDEQKVLFKVFFLFYNMKIYIPILAILLIYWLVYHTGRINKELLLSFCGILFAIFLALCPPMPGWYIWIVPFITIFFINMMENKHKNIIIYLALNMFYLIYFVFFHHTQYVDLYLFGIDMTWLKIDHTVGKNLFFTCMTGTLIYLIILMYWSGVASNRLYRRKDKPFTIGITGDSGSGKSTLVGLLKQSLGNKNVLLVEGDGDHKWERGDIEWNNYTHLDPKANYLYRQAMNIAQLKKGNSVKRVDYAHDTGKFTKNHKIYPNRFILFSGLHSLYLPQMRQQFDLKIYMDVEENLRRYWKINRDLLRGHSKEQIIQSINTRMKDSYAYIIPQKKYADLILQYFDADFSEDLNSGYKPVLSLRAIMSNAIDMEDLVNSLKQYNVDIKYDFLPDLDMQQLVVNGKTIQEKKLPLDSIAYKIIPQLDEITRESIDLDNNINGIIILIILIIISYQMIGD